MFVQCPRCRSLVATDAVSGVAPEFCPYCDSPLADAATAQAEVEPARDPESAIEASTPPPESVAVEPVDEAAPEDIVAVGAEAASESVAIVPENNDPAAHPDPRPEDRNEAAAEPPVTATEPAKKWPAAESAPAKPKSRKKTAAPSFARRRQRTERPTPPWLWAIAAALGLLAGLQIVLADRAQFAADARWRPAIASLCATLHCSIPPWREPAAFAMLGREVRQHPYMPGALRVNAAFRNNARWAQPWPDLVLTLSDVDGRALGTRTFSPKEYLGGKVTQKEIGSGQTAAIRMEIMEPAPGVVAFSFDFR